MALPTCEQTLASDAIDISECCLDSLLFNLHIRCLAKLQKHDKGTNRSTENDPEMKKRSEFKKLYGMQAAIRKGTFTFNGWPLGHVVSCLWGSKGKLISILGHHEMCGIP